MEFERLLYISSRIMTRLRQRIVEDMQLPSLAEKTQAAYVRAVRPLAEQTLPSVNKARLGRGSKDSRITFRLRVASR